MFSCSRGLLTRGLQRITRLKLASRHELEAAIFSCFVLPHQSNLQFDSLLLFHRQARNWLDSFAVSSCTCWANESVRSEDALDVLLEGDRNLFTAHHTQGEGMLGQWSVEGEDNEAASLHVLEVHMRDRCFIHPLLQILRNSGDGFLPQLLWRFIAHRC